MGAFVSRVMALLWSCKFAGANLETKTQCIQRMQALQGQAAGQGGTGIWKNAIAH